MRKINKRNKKRSAARYFELQRTNIRHNYIEPTPIVYNHDFLQMMIKPVLHKFFKNHKINLFLNLSKLIKI